MMTTATSGGAALDHRYAGIFTPTSSNNDSNKSNMIVVSPGFETQTLLESLYAVTSIEDIGSNKFMTAYCVNLERLSVQAHWTAGVITDSQTDAVAVGDGQLAATPGLGNVLSSLISGGADSEEYIVEAFLENIDKLEALIKTMLALELWRKNVLFIGRRKNMNVPTEEEEVEFEIEGGERGGDETDQYYNDLNEVDGGKADTAPDDYLDTKDGLACLLASNGNALRTAFTLHSETTIVSLLNLIFYKGIPAGLLESSGDDVLLSLVDYCARQLIFLGSPEEFNPALSRQKNPLPTSQLSGYLQHRSRINEIQDSTYDSSYQTAIASVTLSRYLCENVDELGPSLLSRVLEVHDFPLLMMPLIQEPPWTRRRSVEKRDKDKNIISTKMIWEKLDEHNEWNEIPSTDLLRLTKLEGQPWLALFHLTTSKVFRESYGLDEYRKSQLMRLRKYIHEGLMDQLPVLEHVARYLDELSIIGVPPSGQGVHRPSSNASSSGLLLQRVDLLRESIVEKRNMQNGNYWQRIAQKQWEEIFSHITDSKDAELRLIASEVYGGEGMDDAMANSAGGDSTPPSAGVQNDVEKEEPQSTVDDWKIDLSKPTEKVVLHMEDSSNNSMSTFALVPVHNGAAATITTTPVGPFQRFKMSISQTDGGGEAIFPHAKVVAHINFQRDPSSDESNEVILSIESLALPTIEHSTTQNSYDEVGIALPTDFSSKEWRQLGVCEKSVVLQLGFKRLSRGVVPAGSTLLRGYILSQAFLSQPVVD